MKNKRVIKAPLVKDLMMNYLLPLSRFEAFLLTVKAVRSAKFTSLTFTCSWRRDLSFLLIRVRAPRINSNECSFGSFLNDILHYSLNGKLKFRLPVAGHRPLYKKQ